MDGVQRNPDIFEQTARDLQAGRQRSREHGEGDHFPYHYGQEAESYTFYRIPKILFTDPVFRKLSTEAKLLYGLLLDRMQLSIRNRWLDEEGRVYIYYTVKNLMEDLSCGNKKISGLLAELDDRHGIGLISRVRQGLGKPDRIYVHKCVRPEMSEEPFQRCQNDTSGDVEWTRPDMSKRHTNDTDKNKTEKNETDLIDSSFRENPDRKMEERDSYRKYLKERLCLEQLQQENPWRREMLDGILDLLVDVCSSSQAFIRIGRDEKPLPVVRSQLLQLTGEHIQYVLDCFCENTRKVYNVRQYLLTSLYNAPMTMESYYTSLVNYDQQQMGFGKGG